MARLRKRTNDPRELPAYTISEAAHYLAVPAATIRYWSVGRDDYAPLIEVPAHVPTLLSFLNLTELHVLAAIPRHEVKMPSVRGRSSTWRRILGKRWTGAIRCSAASWKPTGWTCSPSDTGN